MQTTAIILAAGRGERAGGGVPKQYRPLAGKPVLAHALAAMAGHPRVDGLVLVTRSVDAAHLAAIDTAGAAIVEGGSTRAASVAAGLGAVAAATRNVLIHDAVRPCVAPALIDRVLDALTGAEAAAPALPVTDALWRGARGRVRGTVARDGLFRAQTPQGFRLAAIRAAHAAQAGDAADDDVAVARAAGIEVAIVAGDEENLKITRPEDFARAARILGRVPDVRTGIGFDVHRFGTGDAVTLCGVRIPYCRGLRGHSDADVGMHALTDAVYGALAEGDIGHHFPPGDVRWAGADSAVFLAHAVALARSRGFRVSNADCTLICEHPKIGPHVAGMKAQLAAAMAVGPDRVSVKATTTERLGFAGREEGIAAQATVTLVRP